ncbi:MULTISPECIES: FAD-dependent monooxygenase [unclassified Streptomyces]|uniref:FAD-dependent monooxygenase n=1 Tax=unclassified Streptomyces TaxID=2593676 RepID=UPI001F28936E|nr:MULTISPECIES: FAD-dependent monooxygenase [unclassified Streptomyces]MCF0088126.1 Salicyloyl-CoA 5-hydroxylase [Streptomyces sp. MH192]MCF0101274.1 Salicyloyl-CoA 5-hydroxylase [Streptomyces sp. MH191]
MKITCIGGGPANLYFAILMKLQDPSHELTVHERDPAGSTYGWGVTYWSPLLDRLRAHDPESADRLRAHSVRWSDGTAHVRGRTTVHHGDEGCGIGRHRLLDLLADRAAGLGVKISYEDEIPAGGPFPEADLLVAGDGVHSAVRTLHREHYGSTLTHGRNRYIWLGTTKVFDSFTFAFVETDHGWIWCYGYAYDTDRSTCVVECAPETWAGLGLDRANEADGRAVLEKLFADVLDGHPLMGRAQPDGSAQWLTFRTLTNHTWHHGNTVLLGDAAHTTHYSIGAGTTLALEDACALAESLRAYGAEEDSAALGAALSAYERRRQSELLHVQSAARHSAQWYENLTRYIDLPPERMFALLGQRHSPLLPYVPPQLYYHLDRAAGQVEALRRLKRWLGPRLARTVHTARAPR